MISDSNTARYKKDEIILTRGTPATNAYMIVSGKVNVYLEEDTKRVDLATLEEGEIFGEGAIFNNDIYDANVEAIEDTELFVITPEKLDEILKGSDPTIRALIRMMRKRLKKTNEALLKSETREFADIVFL